MWKEIEVLLNLTVENWMSYRDEASLELTSSLERQHLGSLAKVPGFRSKKALPVAAVYGGNASGKTGIFQALACLKDMVTIDPGVNGIVPVEPFMLDSESRSRPTVLDITFLSRGTVYRLVAEATEQSVVYESLETVTERGARDVYERDATSGEPIKLNGDFFEDVEHANYAAKSTRSNQLFLGNAVAQNIVELREAYDWFNETLQLVGVESQAWSFATCATEREGFLSYAGNVLSELDTGIAELAGESIGLDRLPSDAQLKKDIAELEPDELITFVGGRKPGDYGFEMVTVRQEGGQPVAELLYTLHEGPDGVKYPFSLSMESSGTQRLMGLLPMLFDLVGPEDCAGEKVYVVDELDRCLHTMLTMRLISDFTASCGSATRKQLLFTTHDLLLMNQSFMRRDEMFIAQRGTDGCSELVALSEYKDIRYDKDLIRSYLDGRFGGIPMIGEAVGRG